MVLAEYIKSAVATLAICFSFGVNIPPREAKYVLSRMFTLTCGRIHCFGNTLHVGEKVRRRPSENLQQNFRNVEVEKEDEFAVVTLRNSYETAYSKLFHDTFGTRIFRQDFQEKGTKFF